MNDLHTISALEAFQLWEHLSSLVIGGEKIFLSKGAFQPTSLSFAFFSEKGVIIEVNPLTDCIVVFKDYQTAINELQAKQADLHKFLIHKK